MKQILILLLICAALAGCGQNSAQPPARPEVSAPVPTLEDSYEVFAWVDKPEPKPGDRVAVFGSLKKNGVYLGGMMMDAFWPDAEKDPRTPDCSELVTYQHGKCALVVEGFPAGEFVPITVRFDYAGQRFTGETGFTPK